MLASVTSTVLLRPLLLLPLLLLDCGYFVVPVSCTPIERCRLRQQRARTTPSPAPSPSLPRFSAPSGSESVMDPARQAASTAAAGSELSFDNDQSVVAHSMWSEDGADSESGLTGISRDGASSVHDGESAGVVYGGGESKSGVAGLQGKDGDGAETTGFGRPAVQIDGSGIRSSDAGKSRDAVAGEGASETGLSGAGETGFGDSSTDVPAETGLAGDAPTDAYDSGSLVHRGAIGDGGRQREGKGVSRTATRRSDGRPGGREMTSHTSDDDDWTGLETRAAGLTGLVDGGDTGLTDRNEATGLQEDVGGESGLLAEPLK